MFAGLQVWADVRSMPGRYRALSPSVAPERTGVSRRFSRRRQAVNCSVFG